MRAVLLALIAALAAPQIPDVRKAERFTGILTAGPLSTRPAAIELKVDRWATEASRQRLAAAFESGGWSALLETLKKEGAAGYVLLPNRERLVAGYVQQESRPDGGRRILLLCARYHGDWEVTRDSGWTDHLFRVVALSLDGADHGEGILFHTAKVTFGATGPELASELSGQPTRILSLRPIH